MTDALLEKYKKLYETLLCPAADLLENLVKGYLDQVPHIDRIAARAKRPDRFEQKALKVDSSGKLRYPEPFVQIQDLIGARVIVFYPGDIATSEALLMNYFTPIEVRTIVPDSEWKFGYFGRHFILALPDDTVPAGVELDDAPGFFELQIKTLFQHAWAEAEHDLGYKAPDELTAEQQRCLAFTSAQAWGADDVFQRLVRQLPQG